MIERQHKPPTPQMFERYAVLLLAAERTGKVNHREHEAFLRGQLHGIDTMLVYLSCGPIVDGHWTAELTPYLKRADIQAAAAVLAGV